MRRPVTLISLALLAAAPATALAVDEPTPAAEEKATTDNGQHLGQEKERTEKTDSGLHLGHAKRGEAVGLAVKKGIVKVKLPGASEAVELDPTQPVPVGATIDATQGVVSLAAASNTTGGTQTADFTGAEFVVVQETTGRRATELRMVGGDFSQCTPSASAAGTARAAGRKPVRRLWGSGHGRFTTRGKNSSATVRGTIWTVTDYCDGTRTTVQRGIVVVWDFARNRTKVVRAGESYFARKR